MQNERPNDLVFRRERLDLPDADQLQRMLKLANTLHTLPPPHLVEAALGGVAALAQADAAAAWNGPAERLVWVGYHRVDRGGAAESGTDPSPSDVSPARMLPAGVALLIGRRPTLSPVVRLHSDPASRRHEIRSVCADGAGPSLLVLRRSAGPFTQRQRAIVHLLHPQIEWTLRPAVATTPLAAADVLAEPHKVVFELMLSGLSEQQIAARLKRTPRTVQLRTREIYRHFNVAGREELLKKVAGGNG